jgi:hypothetical protein
MMKKRLIYIAVFIVAFIISMTYGHADIFIPNAFTDVYMQLSSGGEIDLPFKGSVDIKDNLLSIHHNGTRMQFRITQGPVKESKLIDGRCVTFSIYRAVSNGDPVLLRVSDGVLMIIVEEGVIVFYNKPVPRR